MGSWSISWALSLWSPTVVRRRRIDDDAASLVDACGIRGFDRHGCAMAAEAALLKTVEWPGRKTKRARTGVIRFGPLLACT
jgi:hypothetical protein